jgi:hypothetical protein
MSTQASTRPTRLYIAGPMTGLPDFNHPAFHAAAAKLRAAGYEVVSPAELDSTHPIADPDGPGAWGRYMRRDIPHLLTCDALALLPGWTESKGARLEAHNAQELGMRMWSYIMWIDAARTRAPQVTAGATP